MVASTGNSTSSANEPKPARQLPRLESLAAQPLDPGALHEIQISGVEYHASRVGVLIVNPYRNGKGHLSPLATSRRSPCPQAGRRRNADRSTRWPCARAACAADTPAE